MNQELGKKGEDLAAKFLSDKGYKVLERNYRTPYGEIDIICHYQDTLIFVEVKTRSSQKYGLPQESITFRKKQHLRKAASLYLNTRETWTRFIRFDVVAILIQGARPSIEHFESAF